MLNVAGRLPAVAKTMPDALAIVEPRGYGGDCERLYRRVTFAQLDQDSDRIAHGLREMGVPKGARLVLLVRPGIDFISLAFAILKAGAVAILIDPGMGIGNMIERLAEAEPEGFVAIPIVQAVRTLRRRRFPKARWNVTVGRRWFWGGATLARLRGGRWSGSAVAATTADDPAAVIFTTGSTGPAKGVLYRHGNFDAQVEQIRDFYRIQPGEIDLACFPFFGLFNCLMGVTAVIPDMDSTRPARVDPAKIVAAIDDWHVTQTFGSPAVWNRVGRWCQERGVRLPTVRRVLSAGAPVAAEVLRQMAGCIHAEGEVHTPYGATEALPVASISSREVLAETARKTGGGAGVCVGRRFPGIQWKVIRIVDGPIASLADIEELVPGEIGELIVSGPQVTREYVTRVEANALAKILGLASEVWHRMGDAGYFDERARFWFCGRVAHRVLTAAGPMYPVCCEAIFNQHADVFRSALVGVGPAGRQRPVMILEPKPGRMPSGQAQAAWLDEIRRLGRANPLTAAIDDFLIHPAFPVDIRHNAKIFREKLAVWAGGQKGLGMRD